LIWFGMSRTAEWRKSSHQMLRKRIPGEAGWGNTKSVQSCHQGKWWLFEEYHFFGYWMIPYVLFHGLDVFTIIQQCKKKHSNPRMSRCF
jgi:hypothetical protein